MSRYTYFPIRPGHYDFEDVGIDRHHNYYYPPSALHEPFATLFAKKPQVALGLVRDLANHATKGWLQTQRLDRRGTPIPVKVSFPWGTQQFWGDWHVYNWFMGQLAPQPLECAFLALSCWAFREINGGRPTDEVIQAVVEENDCYALLGLALLLALETYHVSETTLPIASCQRLWRHDIARFAQEPMRNIDLLGFGDFFRLTGEKAKAKEFLESRRSRKREIRELAMRFALSRNDALRERFKEALSSFPDNLPYEIEEHCEDADASNSLKEDATRWFGLGDIKNYRMQETETDKVLIAYEPPVPLTPTQEKHLEESASSLREYTVIAWATKSLAARKIADGINLNDAIAFAKARDNATIFARRLEAGENSAQATVSAVAAVIIRLGPTSGPDYDWAWDVMERVCLMLEPEGVFPGSKMPWHPCNHLAFALFDDRRSILPRPDSTRRLFTLTAHPLQEVAALAFQALFLDPDEHVRWVAAQRVMDLSIYHRFEIREDGMHDKTADRTAREQSLASALGDLYTPRPKPLTDVPPAWVKYKPRSTGKFRKPVEWDDADPCFNPQFAAKFFPMFPIEAWCQSAVYKALFAKALKQLVEWTAERLVPSWQDQKSRRRSDRSNADLIEWNRVLGDLLARAAPFFEATFVRTEYLAPFLTHDDEGLAVLAPFSEMTVTRQLLDAPLIPANTFDLLSDCVERVFADGAFNPESYRAGEIHGHHLPKLIDALLFVAAEKDAPGAARFANGDWSQVGLIMPLVTRLVTSVGWSAFVAQKFITLCERAGTAYPLDAFATQADAVLANIGNAKGSWAGTLLPARIATTVQRLADANFPLRIEQAQALLRVLDGLIDLGDRRSAALEQTEAFKGIQGSLVPLAG